MQTIGRYFGWREFHHSNRDRIGFSRLSGRIGCHGSEGYRRIFRCIRSRVNDAVRRFGIGNSVWLAIDPQLHRDDPDIVLRANADGNLGICRHLRTFQRRSDGYTIRRQIILNRDGSGDRFLQSIDVSRGVGDRRCGSAAKVRHEGTTATVTYSATDDIADRVKQRIGITVRIRNCDTEGTDAQTVFKGRSKFYRLPFIIRIVIIGRGNCNGWWCLVVSQIDLGRCFCRYVTTSIGCRDRELQTRPDITSGRHLIGIQCISSGRRIDCCPGKYGNRAAVYFDRDRLERMIFRDFERHCLQGTFLPIHYTGR